MRASASGRWQPMKVGETARMNFFVTLSTRLLIASRNYRLGSRTRYGESGRAGRVTNEVGLPRPVRSSKSCHSGEWETESDASPARPGSPQRSRRRSLRSETRFFLAMGENGPYSETSFVVLAKFFRT